MHITELDQYGITILSRDAKGVVIASAKGTTCEFSFKVNKRDNVPCKDVEQALLEELDVDDFLKMALQKTSLFNVEFKNSRSMSRYIKSRSMIALSEKQDSITLVSRITGNHSGDTYYRSVYITGNSFSRPIGPATKWEWRDADQRNSSTDNMETFLNIPSIIKLHNGAKIININHLHVTKTDGTMEHHTMKKDGYLAFDSSGKVMDSEMPSWAKEFEEIDRDVHHPIKSTELMKVMELSGFGKHEPLYEGYQLKLDDMGSCWALREGKWGKIAKLSDLNEDERVEYNLAKNIL